MNIIRQKNTENELHNIVRQFTSLISLSKLAKLVNYRRHSEISLMKIIEWLLTTKFLGRSLYRAHETPNFTSRTVRNNLNDSRINWQRLVCQVGSHLIKHLQPFIDRRRRLDDTLFSREYATQTELLASAFDHDKQLFIKGYRALTLGWSDANTFLPVNFALMSSKKPQNVLGKTAQITDQRIIADHRRSQAQQRMNLVSLQLVKQALANGVPTDYVLFDSWYSAPKMFYELTKLGLNGVACLNVPVRFTIGIAAGSIRLKHYTNGFKLQNISPRKLIGTVASSKHTLGAKDSSFAWYLWLIGPDKMTI